MDAVITPTTKKLVPGEGMPVYDPARIDLSLNRAPLQQGDLLIQFDIEFPTQIDHDTKNALLNILAWLIFLKVINNRVASPNNSWSG